ncbi:MAG: acyltransferase family protein, partial [Bacteroidales bacterium]|nr:acyltransferase family protein [Bacteroidales bacterium]
INGPWWFFGLIFQLYLLFPYLFKIIKRWRWKAFAVICVISYTLIFLFRYVYTKHGGEMIMMNAPGNLPVFCLGILLAFCKDKKINVLWLVAALVVFCLGNYFAVFYPFTFLSLTVLMVFAYQGLKSLPIRKKELASVLSYFGGISMALFATHAVYRDPIIKIYYCHGPWGHLWSGVVFFLIAWGVAIAAKALYDFIVSLLDKIHIRENSMTHYLGIIGQVAIWACFAWVLVKFY